MDTDYFDLLQIQMLPIRTPKDHQFNQREQQENGQNWNATAFLANTKIRKIARKHWNKSNLFVVAKKKETGD